jgi:DnaK suppressor protein
MATISRSKTAQRAGRSQELRRMLETRRRELAQEVQGKIRNARTGTSMERDVRDEVESSDINIQDDIEFRLTQMKAETLKSVDTALSRLRIGIYGTCIECGGEIAEGRLRALPFAVRCRDCEEARETVEQRTKGPRRDWEAFLLDLRN